MTIIKMVVTVVVTSLICTGLTWVLFKAVDALKPARKDEHGDH
ncbi:hypothetical protein OM416_20475 [Paenibacillus sp. LS1]|nr:hypothetical protein [Paenibacillus sp. LS1]MCW3793974.1 hypothetical protein [Paenibacillus sp. LS1]